MNIKDYRKNAPVVSGVLLNQIIGNSQKKQARAKDEGKKIAWTSMLFPALFLHSLNLEPFYPQYGVNRHQYTEMADILEGKWEVPKDICSEVKTSLGRAFIPSFFDTPSPALDMLISTNIVCMQAVNAFEVIGNSRKVPHYFIDIPYTDKVQGPEYENYLAKQYANFVEKIKFRFHLRLDEERFRRGATCMFQSLVIWNEILKLCRHRPSPIDAQDLYLFLFPLMAADMSCDGFEIRNMYIMLYNELCETINRNTSEGRKGEKYRIYWEPQFIALRKSLIKNTLARYGGAVVMDSAYVLNGPYSRSEKLLFHYPLTLDQVGTCYRQSDILTDHGLADYDRMDPGQLFAKVVLFMDVSNRNLAWKKDKLKNIFTDFHIDAVIMMLLQSCRVFSLQQTQLLEYIDKELHMPVLMIQADGLDARNFAEAQFSTRIEAFLENL